MHTSHPFALNEDENEVIMVKLADPKSAFNFWGYFWENIAECAFKAQSLTLIGQMKL